VVGVLAGVVLENGAHRAGGRTAVAIEHAAGSRLLAGVAQSLATAGAQHPVPDVVTAVHQVTAVEGEGVVFAPDGRTLAAPGWAGPVILWDLTSLNDLLDHAVGRACSIAVGGFDQDEWKRRIPEAPYQDTCPSGGG
jgi:hypothetical protein